MRVIRRFARLDRASRPHHLVVSAYLEEPGVALWRFDLDLDSHLPSAGPATNAYHLPFTHAQGATTRKDRFCFNSSESSPRLRCWSPGTRQVFVIRQADFNG
jgi:hypothetical protein